MTLSCVNKHLCREYTIGFEESRSSSHGLPAHSLPLLLLLFSGEETLLLVGRHALELAVTLLFLGLVGEGFPVFGTLGLDELADLLLLLLAGQTHAASHLGSEVSGADKLVGQAKEVGEERGGVGVGVELQRQSDTLLRDEIIETGLMISKGMVQRWKDEASRLWGIIGHIGDD